MSGPVLLVSEIFPPQVGGSGRWLYEVYRRMPLGSVRACAARYAGDSEFDAQADLPIDRLPLNVPNWGIVDPRGWRGYYLAYRALAKLVRQHSPRELHCGRCLPEGWLALMLKARYGLPFVCYVHGEEMPIAAQSRELRWMANRVLRHSRLLVANTANTAQMLSSRWNVPANKTEVLHPGVDTSRFVPAPADAYIRQKLGWNGAKVVLTVGRLQKRKGHDMLIRALPAIRQRVPDVLYAIVGDGPERESLEQLVGETGVTDVVRFHGELSDAQMIECYQQCDLFVLPNREVDGDFEGFGMVLVEAQACGKPVLAGASGGTHETMDIPATGEVVSCVDPLTLAQAVIRLLQQELRRSEMGLRARDWAAKQFDWESLRQSAQDLLGIHDHPPSFLNSAPNGAVSLRVG